MIVEAQYKWNGELSGYRDGDRSIPLDPGNVDFQTIQRAMSDGKCSLTEPPLGEISQANDRHGQFSGYHTRFGFVPSYRNSHLLKLIDEQLVDGRCTVADPVKQLKVDPEFKLQKLVFSTILEQPWSHISGDFFGEFPYASHAKSEKRSFRFSIKNILSSSSDKFQLLLEKHKIETGFPFSFSPTQFGVIEIEVPITELKRLFKGEQHLIEAWMLPFHADLLEQHFAQTRRKPSEGPDIGWLISHVNLYMGHFVVEFCNHVIEAFRREYGHIPVPYLSEKNAGIKTVVLGYSESGSARLQTLVGGTQNHTFNLSGEWPSSSLLRYEEETRSISFYQRTALVRVSEMVRLGFHAEALGPLNAFFEVAVRWALASCVRDSAKHYEFVVKMGHKPRLDILDSIANAQLDSYVFDDKFKERLITVRAIYKRRNYYLHTLQLPDITGRLTLMDRRRLETQFHGFLDAWEQNQFLMRLTSIADDKDAIRRVAMNEIEKRMPAASE